MKKINTRLMIFPAFLFCLFTIKGVKAQTYREQQKELLLYNVGLNSLIGGIGGVINKKKDEKCYHAFLKNLGFGALGGLVKYHAKHLTYHIDRSDVPVYPYLNRMYYYLGHSIVNNASLNRPIHQHYSFQLFLAHVDVSWQEQFIIKPRISLTTLGYTIRYLGSGHKLDIENSLRYGVFYYDRGDLVEKLTGFGTANTIGITRDFQSIHSRPSFLIPHEMVHTYQYSDYFLLINFSNQSFRKIKQMKLYKFLNNYLYWDVNFFGLMYGLQNELYGEPIHFNNFYEYEAHLFAIRSKIYR